MYTVQEREERGVKEGKDKEKKNVWKESCEGLYTAMEKKEKGRMKEERRGRKSVWKRLYRGKEEAGGTEVGILSDF